MSAKTKSALSETPNTKVSPAAPRASKPSRVVAKSDADSASSLQNHRLSLDRSPKSVTSKPTVDRRSPKLSTPPDKKTPPRILKPSELQAELNLAQEDLKKAKEKLVLVEKEKEKALDELKEARKLAEEANEKLREALLAQKRAEEDSEIEKFRAVEMEQAGIEAAQKEEEWHEELEAMKNQHAVDMAALLSATQELQKVKQELAMTCDAKNQALSHADDATKIAEAQADKVEALSAELIHLKSVLDMRVQMEAGENNKFASELKLEIDSLRKELERTKTFEEKLAEREAMLEQLNVDLEAAKMAESYAHNLVEELQKRVVELASHAEQAKRLERSASESMESVMKQLESSKSSLHIAESEVAALKEKVGLLEISIDRQKGDLEESECHLQLAKEEASDMAKKVESIRSELERVNGEKIQSLNNEKLAAANVQTLSEEKNKLVNELETSRNEEDKSKKALESLASALHEVSSEARDAKEKLLLLQVERENYETQISDLKLVLKATTEKYENILDSAKEEIDALTNSVEQSESDYENVKTELEQKELSLVNSAKKFEAETSSMQSEISKLTNLLKMAEEEACATREEEGRWKNSFKETESEVIYLKEAIAEAKAESMRLKEGLMDRGNELQNILQENEELQKREAAALKKVEELSKLLEEALSKKQGEENLEVTDSEKDYDMLPKVVEFSEQNGTGDVKPKVEVQSQQRELTTKENLAEIVDVATDESVPGATEMESSIGKLNDKEKDDPDCTEVDLKTWESSKIEKKDFSHEGEREQETIEDEVDSKADGVESYPVNGLSSTENLDIDGSSPSKQQSQKKKKPLLHKFGSLLKKKGTSNQK